MGEPDLDQLPGNTPGRVRRLIERSLRKDPQSRLRDIGDARLVLEESLAGHEWKTAGAAAVEPGAPARRSPAWAAVLVVAGIVIGAVAGWIIFRPSSPDPRPVTRVPIVAREASVDVPWPVISPDGTFIVFQGQQGGLYARRLDRYDESLIRGTEGDSVWPAFSPDGKWLAFIRQSTPPKLMKLPVDASSPPVELAELPEGSASLAWPRGGFLFTLTPKPFSLVRVSVDGGPSEPALKLPSGLAQNFMLLTDTLPSDRYLLAAGDSYGDRGWQMNVLALDTETGEARVLVEDGVFAAWSPTEHLVFSRRGTLLAVSFDEQRIEVLSGPVAILDGLRMPAPAASGWFRFSNDGTLVYQTGAQQFTGQLVIVDRDGNVQPWSEDRRDFAERLAVSRDGKLLAAQVINWEEGLEEIWVSEFDRPRLRPLVDEPGLDCSRPVLTPDAVHIVYACGGAADVGGVYMRSTDGTTPPELLLSRRSSDEYQFPNSISPNGSSLLISRFAGPDAGLLLFDLDSKGPAERQLRVLMTSGIDLLYGAWFSPDGSRTTRMTPVERRSTSEQSVATALSGRPNWSRPVVAGARFGPRLRPGAISS
jgi:Tol biopolymer transport system component